jgi:hypothetical protein
VQTKLRKDKVAETVSPLVSRIASDDELRAHAKTALDSARSIYQKIQSDGPRDAARNKDVHDEVMKAATEIRHTARRLAENSPSSAKRKRHGFRKLVLGSAIVIGAIAASKKLLHRDEDEFDYQP